VAEVLAKVARFEANQQAVMQHWRRRLEEWQSSGKRVLAWGAGARAIVFLSAFAVTDGIPHVVDINPKRQGKYLPVTGQRVVPPEFVRDYRPDLVLITNSSFSDEIKRQARELGTTAAFEEL
jgi:FlaA1/EpsC-like NDP-sugar epimerase